MGNKRLKLHRGINDFVPSTVNFSVLESGLTDNDIGFDAGDHGLEKKRIEDNIQYEEMVLQILCNLESREKIIFMFQLLRDGGYQIDHGSLAKVINLSRSQYMRVLDTVRTKSALYVAGYSSKRKKRATKGVKNH